jgi:hypothetical protein
MPIFKTVIRGHLDLTRKLPELPDVLEQVWIDEVETPQEVANLVYTRLGNITKDGGMGVRFDDGKGGLKKIFVLLHMIEYISNSVGLTPQNMPVEDPDNPGEFLDNSGNKLRKQ